MTAGKELILAYNFQNSPNGRMLKLICMQMGIRVKAVEPSMYGLTLEALTQLKDGEPVEAPAETGTFSEEMLVMCGLSGSRLDEFLAQLRRQKLRIPLKAVLTAHNRSWTSLALIDEIRKEHEMMNRKNG